MNATHRPRGRAVGLVLGAAGLLLTGCASDKVLETHQLASPPMCAAQDGDANATASLFGCANAANLKAMVANPHDLQEGRPLSPASAEHEAKAVEAYKKGQVKKPANPSDKPAMSFNFTPGTQ